VGNRLTRKVNALSSIPFEEADEIDFESHTRPMARVALGMGASLVAMWICPLIMALGAMASLGRATLEDATPDPGPVDQPTEFPSIRAA
jgi:hypothetical protein